MTNEFKPTRIIYTGDKVKGVEYLKFARKLLTQSKERNEQLGHYAQPFYSYKDAQKTIKVTSLTGYDIIEIFAPEIGGGEEFKTTKLYSGMFEPRYNPASLAWYLRYWPSTYELFNADQNLAKGLGSSIDGAKVDPPMPPNRWMYNDYDYDAEEEIGLQEAPWFALNGAPQRWLTGVTAGKFSGQLRKLVQLQLGMGLYPQFDGKTDFIRLEELASGKTRIWLYTISNGVRMQLMGDYDQDSFEDSNGFKRGSIPPEFEEAGFFSYQTSFDETRQEYTKAEYDALNPQPGLPEVTFKLMTAAEYNVNIGSFAALGDYGWSFNSLGTQGTFTGITTNYPEGRNYKSQQFRMFVQGYVVSIVGFGEKLFLMDSSADFIKVPNEIGELETFYFWRADDGFIGTQPSDQYTAPMYSYMDLADQEQVISYTFKATAAISSVGGAWTGWADAVACRRASYITVNGYPNSYDYSPCTYGRDGDGIDGGYHGFTSAVTNGTDEKYAFSGTEFHQSGRVPVGGYMATGFWLYRDTPGGNRPLAFKIDSQVVQFQNGDFGADSSNVLVIPSFERLAYYHFKSYSDYLTDGDATYDRNFVYDGSDGRAFGDGVIGPCDPGIGNCSVVAVDATPFGSYGDVVYWGKEFPNCTAYDHGPPEMCGLFGSSPNQVPHPCWTNPGNMCSEAETVPAAQDPFVRSSTTLTGGLLTPHGTLVIFSDADMNAANPLRESSENYGIQGMVTAFDTFTDRWVFSLPDVGITAIQENLNSEFTSEFLKYPVGFVGAPYYR